MTSDSMTCSGYFTDHRNSGINNYFTSSGGGSNSGGGVGGNNDISHHHNNGSRGSTTSNSSANSSNCGNNSSSPSNRWNNESGNGSGSSSSTENKNQNHNQNISNHETQYQRHQQHQQQLQHEHHQEQHHNNQHHNHHHHNNHSQQHQQHHNNSQQIQQNIIASSTNNCHLIFGSGNFHHRSNNSWSMPSLSCYQRIYGDNHYIHGFNNQNINNNNNTVAQHQNSNTNNNESVVNQLNHHHQQQHLQNNKRFLLNSGKSGNSKDICGDDKFKEDGDPWNVEAQAAFLGPNLWDKTLPYDADLKVTQYADLDEFLSENNIPDGLPGTHLGHSAGLGHRSDSLGHSAGLTLGLGHVTKRERSPSPSDCVSPDTINPPSPAESTFSFASSGRDFDPRTRAFSDEELKPQPMIKKSRKQFVPDELKDDKYWARRRKNNIAAKRSRDARRQKENQIAMRARYLEKENATLHQEVEQLKQENMELRARLSKYQEV